LKAELSKTVWQLVQCFEYWNDRISWGWLAKTAAEDPTV